MNAIYLISFYLLKALVFLLPSPILRPFFIALARLYFKLSKKRRENLLTNLNLAFEESLSKDEKLKIAKRCYENFALFLGLGFLQNQNASKKSVLAKTSFKNEKFFTDALASGRGVIVATAHLGQWELFSLAMAARYGGIAIVGRSVDSKAINAILQRHRSQFNIELIEKSGAAKGILKALKAGKTVGILVDQNTAKDEGVEVSFFGKRALHTPAASVLALKTGALIVPAFIRNLKNGTSEIEFNQPIDLELLATQLGKDKAILSATQAQASSCEAAVRKAVDEYFWFHKRFKHFYEKEYI